MYICFKLFSLKYFTQRNPFGSNVELQLFDYYCFNVILTQFTQLFTLIITITITDNKKKIFLIYSNLLTILGKCLTSHKPTSLHRAITKKIR